MFGQTGLGSNTSLNSASSRMFRVEVQGLRQTYQSDKLSYPIRQSGSVFISVPYSRMNEEMQRINRLGGKIVSIQPLVVAESASPAKEEATAANQPAKTSTRKSSSSKSAKS